MGATPASLPRSVLSPPYLPASIAIYTIVALVAFEGLAVVAALPQIAADLGDLRLIPWVITSYLLTSSVAAVAAGPIIDALGVRTVFLGAVSLFTVVGSAVAFSPNLPVMIPIRVVQGIGGGMVFAVAITAVGLVYPSHLIGRAFAANSTVWGVMSVAGPALASALLTYLSWRWIFLVNLPIGLAALAAGWRAMPRGDRRGPARVDWLGMAWVSVFTGATLLAVDRLGVASFPWLGLAVVAAFLYWRHARRASDPVMRLEHLARQPFGGLAVGMGLLLAGAFCATTYLPLYVSAGLQGSTGLAAWSVLYFTIGWTVGSNLASRATARWSETGVALWGYLLVVPALAVGALVAFADAPYWMTLATQTVAGVGVGIATNAALTLLRAVSRDEVLGRTNAAHQFLRTLGLSYGAALGGALLLTVAVRTLGDIGLVERLLAGEIVTSADPGAAVRRGFSFTVAAGAMLTALGSLPILALRRHLAAARALRRPR